MVKCGKQIIQINIFFEGKFRKFWQQNTIYKGKPKPLHSTGKSDSNILLVSGKKKVRRIIEKLTYQDIADIDKRHWDQEYRNQSTISAIYNSTQWGKSYTNSNWYVSRVFGYYTKSLFQHLTTLFGANLSRFHPDFILILSRIFQKLKLYF